MSERATGVEPDSGEQEPPRESKRRRRRRHSNPAVALTRKIVVTTVGSTVMLAGIIMLVTPGPAFVLIPIGLAILATEWDWADRWLQKAKDQARKAKANSDAMDPKVRRRRLIILATTFVLVVGAVTAYVLTYGWPTVAIDGWDWVQGIAGWLPELPGPTAESKQG